MTDTERIEELEQIIVDIMKYVGPWIKGTDIDRCEVDRAKIMSEKVKRALEKKDQKIKDLQYNLERSDKLCNAALFLLGRQV